MKKTRAQVSYNMSRVRSKGSLIEKTLEKALRSRRLRYRKHPTTVFGCPDFVLPESRVAIFCDSHFWHGYHWKTERLKIKTNRRFWLRKIEANIARDRLVSRTLKKSGWHVIRFWETRISNDLDGCVEVIQEAINHG